MPENQPQNAQNGQQQEGNWLYNIVVQILKIIAIQYIISTVAGSFFRGNSGQDTLYAQPSSNGTNDIGVEQHAPPLPSKFDLAWNQNQHFDLHVYSSERGDVMDPMFQFFNRIVPQKDFQKTDFEELFYTNFKNHAKEIWVERNLVLNDPQMKRMTEITDFPIPKSVQENGTLYAYVVAFPYGSSWKNPKNVLFFQTALTAHYPHKKHYTRNLMSKEEEDPSISKETQTEVLNFWTGNCSISILPDFGGYGLKSLTPPVQKMVRVQYTNNTQGNTEGHVFPIFYEDKFWKLRSQMFPVNETTPTVSFQISIEPTTVFWLMMTASLQESFDMQQKNLGVDVQETEEFKRMLIETDPWLLGLTLAVTLLHTVFDFLAFKNDISHWRNKKTLEGTSVKTLFLNAGCQVIVFLYLLDNEASFMVLVSIFLGMLIEFWKIHKSVSFKIDKTKLFPISVDYRQSYVSKTKEYDDIAMQYLGYLLYPLVIGYSTYSLFYDDHKSWYSWIVTSLYMSVFMFGFIMMTPQLFINYKLKSVAHLPWRAFVYKALNTFIDDLFAFIIKMPTLHRLSCFRDDIIFAIFLYQRWIYRVDKTRVNEFGQDFVEEEGQSNGSQSQSGNASQSEKEKKD